jgi:hypothetical protein
MEIVGIFHTTAQYMMKAVEIFLEPAQDMMEAVGIFHGPTQDMMEIVMIFHEPAWGIMETVRFCNDTTQDAARSGNVNLDYTVTHRHIIRNKTHSLKYWSLENSSG